MGHPSQGTSQVAWTPSADLIERANVTRFMRAQGIGSYDELMARCATETEWFWDVVAKDLGIEWFTPYSRVMDCAKGIPWTEWYLGGRLNITHNCVDRHAQGPRAGKVALIAESEEGQVTTWTYAELADRVTRAASALRNLGIRRGDTVGVYLPMMAEVAIILPACFKVGAIVIPIFSGFAPRAVAERLRDAGARLLFTATYGLRRGMHVDLKGAADETAALTPSISHLVVVTRGEQGSPWVPGRDLSWEEFLAKGAAACETEAMASMEPAMILYTSGTTGKPKGTVHSHAGTLVQVAKEIGYHFDLKETDRFFWLSDIGWMMGPWMIIGCFHHGGTILLYEGALDYPDSGRLWEMIDRHGITTFGISPTAIRMLMRSGTGAIERRSLRTLRILGSTGEPWDPDSWWWYFEKVGGRRCPVINISGGTDIVGCFLIPLPIKELKPCSLQGPGLGMSVDVWNEEGTPVRGEVGYLVATKPAPSMTRGFWQDSERYLETYWSRWPNIWDHGDWALIDPDGHWFLHGRADDTIKVAGRRIGPAEVEGALIDHPAVSEAAAIGVPHALKGEAIVCFAVLAPGYEASAELRGELKRLVVSLVGKADRPERIEFVSDLPKTRSAKIMRRVIRARYLGQTDLGDLSSCQNPDTIAQIPTQGR